MEISKSLQEEIYSVQSELRSAIKDHQICVGKLKDDPNNPDVMGQIQEIQLHIISLGRCQKQVVQRLRKEVGNFQAANSNQSTKVSIASLLGLNNNNIITHDNETKNNGSGAKILNGLARRSSKEAFEEPVRNVVVVPSQVEDRCVRSTVNTEKSSSAEAIFGKAETAGKSLDKSSTVNSDGADEGNKTCDAESSKQLKFLGNLGLITTEQNTELRNRRAERKRRSNAGSQFVSSTWEVPTKRRGPSYLQSTGSAPQTRQSTARSNGLSPSSRTASRESLMPTQKSTTRPNILRNAGESKVFTIRSKLENGSAVLDGVGSKAVHIPGLPSSLTIERIGNDSTPCQMPRKDSGALAICEECSATYETSALVPPKTCPECSVKAGKREENQDNGIVCKRENQFEERERESYELRERNSDLRLQVYELEKRSQLLGQSLQLQHRTRQDLLGKQEKTQRSIKRLVDFIQLMQRKKEPSSSSPSLSSAQAPPPSTMPRLSSLTPSPQLTASPGSPPEPSATVSSCHGTAQSSLSCPSSRSPQSPLPLTLSEGSASTLSQRSSTLNQKRAPIPPLPPSAAVISAMQKSMPSSSKSSQPSPPPPPSSSTDVTSPTQRSSYHPPRAPSTCVWDHPQRAATAVRNRKSSGCLPEAALASSELRERKQELASYLSARPVTPNSGSSIRWAPLQQQEIRAKDSSRLAPTLISQALPSPTRPPSPGNLLTTGNGQNSGLLTTYRSPRSSVDSPQNASLQPTLSEDDNFFCSLPPHPREASFSKT